MAHVSETSARKTLPAAAPVAWSLGRFDLNGRIVVCQTACVAAQHQKLTMKGRRCSPILAEQ